jgi:hypothetical protein
MTRIRSRRWTRAGVVVALAAASGAAWGAGCSADNAVVGGSCAAGYTDCNGACVELSVDQNNCGTCGSVCASGGCVAGSCGGKRDAATDARADGAKDGSTHDGTTDGSDGSPFDASRDALHHDAPADGTAVDGSTGDGSDGGIVDGSTHDSSLDARADQCAPPYDTVASCGACGAACTAIEVCSPVLDAGADAGTYACAPACTPPLSDCSGTCVDETSDPDNCGACGRVCPSGICVASLCTGAALGDIVVIGHDYAAANVRISESTLLSNAVFLPPTNPLRVLSFEQYAVAAQVTNVQKVLKAAALSSGRQIAFTKVTDSTLVPADLMTTTFDVLLVYDQGAAPAGALQPIGAAWQMSLGNFVAVGGDVVVLDGHSGANPQMADLLSASGLLQTTAEVPITQGTQLSVVASGDAVGNFVVSPYAAQNDTVSFVTSEANGGNVTYVVDDGSDAAAVPVVIHKTP